MTDGQLTLFPVPNQKAKTVITRSFLRDTAERVIATLIQTFLAVVVAAGTDYVDIATWKAAAVAGGAAALAALKAAVARLTGDPDTAALV